jgi:hypothetical protein
MVDFDVITGPNPSQTAEKAKRKSEREPERSAADPPVGAQEAKLQREVRERGQRR